jgi:YHS domain-containing protein
MKNLLFLAVIFAAVFMFNTNSYSQCSGETVEKKSCCYETVGNKSCCPEKNTSSGEKQISDSTKSETIVFAVCPVSKEEFKAGAGKKISYLGKEYEFCCDGCVAEFKAEPIGYTGGVATCPICNHDDGSSSITMMHKGIKYYFCAEGCKTKFSKNPEKILEEYNK